MTDMITVSRKEIEKLRNLTRYSFLSPSEGGVRRFQDKSGAWVEHYEMFKIIEDLLDKAEVSEPVGYKVTGKLGERCSFKSSEVKKGDIIYTTPQPSRVSELEAEIARLKATP